MKILSKERKTIKKMGEAQSLCASYTKQTFVNKKAISGRHFLKYGNIKTA
ncbi:hypothetical protein MTBBW1_3230002 [Desulfamplus magnetovallimortis]|uniref:Uncharacterized protein n=1 Tax=Desulfamplus magnetovallimortis TaxID=1246637 RepID=A0A1W1HGB2_9BACT|nr:hypothetical protein MTBBW1_3230002 [Desulfamplus magnetovallimortis]